MAQIKVKFQRPAARLGKDVKVNGLITRLEKTQSAFTLLDFPSDHDHWVDDDDYDYSPSGSAHLLPPLSLSSFR